LVHSINPAHHGDTFNHTVARQIAAHLSWITKKINFEKEKPCAMKHYLPQISWHNQEAIYSIDFQRTVNGTYKILTAGINGILRVSGLVK